MLIGLVGAKVAVDPNGSLEDGACVDFVCREEFDFTCLESRRASRSMTWGLCYRDPTASDHTRTSAPIENMDALPGYAGVRGEPDDRELLHRLLKHRTCRSTPAADANRAARSACGRRRSGPVTRVRSPANVIGEVAWIQKEHAPGARDLFR